MYKTQIPYPYDNNITVNALIAERKVDLDIQVSIKELLPPCDYLIVHPELYMSELNNCICYDDEREVVKSCADGSKRYL